MSADSPHFAGVVLITVPTVVFGGVRLLTMIFRRESGYLGPAFASRVPAFASMRESGVARDDTLERRPVRASQAAERGRSLIPHCGSAEAP